MVCDRLAPIQPRRHNDSCSIFSPRADDNSDRSMVRDQQVRREEMKLIDGHDVIEHAEVNGENRDFIKKLTDYIEDAPVVEPKMQRKEYKLPNGKTAVFEYDACEIGKITLECMDELMSMIADRPQGEWIYPTDIIGFGRCGSCGSLWDKSLIDNIYFKYCPRCGSRMKGADNA